VGSRCLSKFLFATAPSLTSVMAPKAKATPEPKAAAAKSKAKAKAKAEAADEGPKVEPPSREEFDAAVAKIQEDIDGFEQEKKALTAKISERSGGKDDYYAKRAEFRAQLDEFTAKIDALMAQKGDVNKAMGEKRTEGLEMKNQLNKMKKSIGYTSEADIDERIATIEMKLVTESITLKEEKEYLKEISDLKRNKPKVAQVNQMQDSLATRDSGAGLRQDIGTINEQISLYRDGKKKVSEGLNELNESRKEQMGDVPQLIEKRDALNKKVQEKIAERNTLRDEFRQKEREFNNFKNERRRQQQDKYMEERAAKNAEWEMAARHRKAESLDDQPFVSEITLIEQTLLFCRSLVADKGPAEKEEKKETTHDNPEGTEILLGKDSREEEYYYVPTASKKKGKSNRKGKESGGAKPIKHNAETFKLFDKLKLNAPITTEDIPPLVEKLEEQLAEFKEKVKQWEVNRDEMKRKVLAGEDVEAKKEEEKEQATEEAKEEE
jgi:uncharacterized coiled-coil DUF342 family protein